MITAYFNMKMNLSSEGINLGTAISTSAKTKKKEITDIMLQNALSEIFDLAVLDINHTQFMDREDVATLLGVKSSNLYSLLYDGKIKIGIDLKKIGIDVNSNKKIITITLGEAKVISNDIY